MGGPSTFIVVGALSAAACRVKKTLLHIFFRAARSFAVLLDKDGSFSSCFEGLFSSARQLSEQKAPAPLQGFSHRRQGLYPTKKEKSGDIAGCAIC